jgi:hypothetical protein
VIVPFGLSIAVLLVALALWGAGLFATGRAPNPAYLIALAIVEVELLIQAVIAVVDRLGGDGGGAAAPFYGYLLLSVVLIPVVARPGSNAPRTRWDSAALAAVCLAVAVAVVRLLSLA